MLGLKKAHDTSIVPRHVSKIDALILCECRRRFSARYARDRCVRLEELGPEVRVGLESCCIIHDIFVSRSRQERCIGSKNIGIIGRLLRRVPEVPGHLSVLCPFFSVENIGVLVYAINDFQGLHIHKIICPSGVNFLECRDTGSNPSGGGGGSLSTLGYRIVAVDDTELVGVLEPGKCVSISVVELVADGVPKV